MIGRKKEKKERVKKEKIGLFKRLRNFIIKIFYKFYNSKLGIKFRELLEWIYKGIEKSIRFELMLVFAICFVAAFFFYGFANNILSRDRTITRLEYDYGEIQQRASDISSRLSSDYEYNQINGLEDEEAIKNILNEIEL